jgi:hypothetical protein
METWGSLHCSKPPATGTCPKPVESSPNPHILFLGHLFRLFSHLRLCLAGGLFTSGFRPTFFIVCLFHMPLELYEELPRISLRYQSNNSPYRIDSCGNLSQTLLWLPLLNLLYLQQNPLQTVSNEVLFMDIPWIWILVNQCRLFFLLCKWEINLYL